MRKGMDTDMEQRQWLSKEWDVVLKWIERFINYKKQVL
jgi:hypothetical protein